VALFISLDKFGGWTSGWIRYVNTAQQLSQLQSNFKLKWEQELISLSNAEEYLDVLKESIAILEKFLNSVHDLVRKETDLWVQEFKGVLHELEKGEKNNNT
jgi:phage terminase large subunit-like protein